MRLSLSPLGSTSRTARISTVDLIAVRLGDVIVSTNGERYDSSPQASLDTARMELTRKAVDKAKRSLLLSWTRRESPVHSSRPTQTCARAVDV
jgi:hypothetical protein